jgi:hypothetical protein
MEYAAARRRGGERRRRGQQQFTRTILLKHSIVINSSFPRPTRAALPATQKKMKKIESGGESGSDLINQQGLIDLDDDVRREGRFQKSNQGPLGPNANSGFNYLNAVHSPSKFSFKNFQNFTNHESFKLIFYWTVSVLETLPQPHTPPPPLPARDNPYTSPSQPTTSSTRPRSRQQQRALRVAQRRPQPQQRPSLRGLRGEKSERNRCVSSAAR